MSQPAYRLFNVELKRREQLSPALTASSSAVRRSPR